MVDPNPGRGMPLQLQRYWLAGKGAAKIRWGMPHDFNRCVRQLRKYFPKNPQGLCNILHQKSLGAPPGKGHGHSITASLHGTDDLTALTAAQALIDRQPQLGKYTWAMPLAPIGRPTGEPRRTRIFEPGSLSHRVLPLPLDARFLQGDGHGGAMTVARILGITYGPDHDGLEYAWGWGDYLDEDIIPEAKRARYLAEMGISGPSVDPGGRVNITVNPETGFEHMLTFVIGGATMVPIPAFTALRQMVFNTEDGDWPDDDPDMVMGMDEEDCGCGPAALTAAVNTRGWRGLPLAPREATFDNDDAVKRIAAWAGVNSQGADVEKMRRAFMYYDPKRPPTDPTSYRLPVGDIINGRLTLIYHAIYAAAALLSGAHGGLPGIPPEDQNDLRNVISEIYPVMATEFNDSSVRAPWDRSAEPGVQMSTTSMKDEYSSSGFPVYPPKAWFEDPQLSRKTRLTVTEEGHVFGHLAAWGECHRDVTMRECVLAPRSQQEYAPFHLGTVLTAEGDTVNVGKIVMDTRHANINLGYTAAALHYDNTGDEVAVIRCGEDEYGIWFSGAVVPEATASKVAKLRRSPLSGDWRREKGSLELTAALAVNAPAFPVYSIEGEEQMALVAAGSVWFEDEPEEVFTPPTGIVAAIESVVKDQYSKQERIDRLADIFDDEEIYQKRERAVRLSYVFTAEPMPPAPAPAPAAGAPAPVAPAPGAPALVPATGESATDAAGMDEVAWQIAAEADAKYSIVAEPGGETSAPEAATPPEQATAPVQATE
jgi:hypothetical protein